MYPDLEKSGRNRMIVILPDALAGNLELARHMHRMAVRNQCDVIYLTLLDDPEKQLIKTRDMATMTSMTADDSLSAFSKIVRTGNWLPTLRDLHRPDDILVCFEKQIVTTGFLMTAPLNQYLVETFKVPVQILSGYYHPARVQVKRLARELLVWIGFLVIAACFTALEINLKHLAHGLAQSVVFMIVVGVEFLALLGWNNITNR